MMSVMSVVELTLIFSPAAVWNESIKIKNLVILASIDRYIVIGGSTNMTVQRQVNGVPIATAVVVVDVVDHHHHQRRPLPRLHHRWHHHHQQQQSRRRLRPRAVVERTGNVESIDIDG
jgi:hypothetical protein